MVNALAPIDSILPAGCKGRIYDGGAVRIDVVFDDGIILRDALARMFAVAGSSDGIGEASLRVLREGKPVAKARFFRENGMNKIEYDGTLYVMPLASWLDNPHHAKGDELVEEEDAMMKSVEMLLLTRGL